MDMLIPVENIALYYNVKESLSSITYDTDIREV